MRTAMSSCLAPARSPIFCARRSNPSSASSAARRYVRLSPALLRRLRLGRGSEGGPRSRRIRRQAGDLGAGDGSVAIRRLGDYSSDYALVKLAKVAGNTKVMADAFIAPSGSDVTPAFQEYL